MSAAHLPFATHVLSNGGRIIRWLGVAGPRRRFLAPKGMRAESTDFAVGSSFYHTRETYDSDVSICDVEKNHGQQHVR
jgi:hypothetical protein